MGDDLGERLVRVGLLTRSALGEALREAPPHGAAMVRELARAGLAEDAVAGFFVAEGFGPLLEARDLALADPSIAERVPTRMAWEFLVFPVRDTTMGTVVAMATPSDRHILSETRRALGREVVATVARKSDIERALRAQRPDADAVAEEPARRASDDAEPLVLELTRRRGPTSTAGYHVGPKGQGEAPSGKLGPRVSIAPDGEGADVEAPLLLVRHKPVAREAGAPSPSAPPSAGAIRGESATSAIPRKSFGKPRASEGERATTGEYGSGRGTATTTVSVPPAQRSSDPKSDPGTSIDDAVRSLTPSRPITRPPASALDAAAPAGTATAEAAARATETGGSRATPSRAPGTRTTSPGIARAGAPVITSPPPAGSWPARATETARGIAAPALASGASKVGEPGAAVWARGATRATLKERPTASDPPPPPARPGAGAAAPRVPESQATLPPPAGPAGDRWDLPRAPPSPPRENKVAAASLVGSKAAAGDIGPVLAGIRAAKDRDTVVRLACDGSITVARAAVFLALKKGVLKGWDGAGTGISRDSVRNLWIPAGSASMFKRVLDEGIAYVGPYGAGIADGLFKAAVGSRGGDVMVQPVLLETKVVGLLCVDDLRPGPLARDRVESLANAVGEAFRRVISAGKTD